MKRLALISGLAAVLLAGGYGAWRASAAPAAAQPQLTAVVQRGDLEDTVTATGTLQPRDYVDVGTQVSGQLKKLHVEIGVDGEEGRAPRRDRSDGLPVARSTPTRRSCATSQAQLADRQAQLKLAEQKAQRQANMMREQATTAEAVQTAEAELRSAKAQIDALKAQIQQTRSTLRGDEANLGYTKIYAPMAAPWSRRAAKQGQTLNANQQAPIVLRIADLSTMTVQSQVSEADVSRLRVGHGGLLHHARRAGKRWYGELRQIKPTPEVVNNVVLYNALFDVPNPDGALMTQMTAQVFFVVGAGEGRRARRAGERAATRAAPAATRRTVRAVADRRTARLRASASVELGARSTARRAPRCVSGLRARRARGRRAEPAAAAAAAPRNASRRARRRRWDRAL